MSWKTVDGRIIDGDGAFFLLNRNIGKISKIQQIIKKINGKKIGPRLPSPNFFFKNFYKITI